MKKIRLLIIGLVSMFVTSACSDFLEEKSQDEVLVRTTKDYDELLLGFMYNTNSYLMLYAMDDDIRINDAKLTGTENGTIKMYSGCFTWQPDMWERSSTLDDGYKYSYTQIMGINAVLDGIDEAVGTKEEREMVKANALGMRGFYYFMLVNLFGEPYNYNKKALGVPIKLTAGLVENGMPRNTVEEVYGQIVKDLKAASDLFEKYPKQTGNYHINVTVVNIWLSRVYLYMERWEEAIAAANKAIETAEGLTDYTRVEGSFVMASYDHSEVEWLYGSNAVSVYFVPSTELYSSYGTNDRRPKFWFSSALEVVKKKVSTTSPTSTVRISEAYLNRAEAYVQSQKDEEALDDLNELRRYRIVGYEDESIMDSQKLLDEIRLERRLELCFDQHRWFDLRRYGMPSISHEYRVKKTEVWMTYTLKEKDPLYVLPIPLSAMTNNTRLEQNPSAYESERMGYSSLTDN